MQKHRKVRVHNPFLRSGIFHVRRVQMNENGAQVCVRKMGQPYGVMGGQYLAIWSRPMCRCTGLVWGGRGDPHHEAKGGPRARA